jgi:hypothetical protein
MIMVEVSYATREQVQTQLEILSTARAGSVIDSKLQAASRGIESLCHRRFYPAKETRYFDWPNHQYADSWQLFLGDNDLISITTLTAGGVVIPSTDYILRRADNKAEPPYTYIEIDTSTNSVFQSGTTFQKSIAINGLWGYNDVDTSVVTGAIYAPALYTDQVVYISPYAGTWDIGTNDVIKCGTELMIVKSRAMLAIGGQALTTVLTASVSDKTVGVTSGSAYAIGSTLLIGAERIRVDDIAGNNLVVTRTYDGTALTTHAISEAVYALQTYTLQRGALGTIAEGHIASSYVYTYKCPSLVRELCILETVALLTKPAKPSKELENLREVVRTTCGRNGRVGAI